MCNSESMSVVGLNQSNSLMHIRHNICHLVDIFNLKSSCSILGVGIKSLTLDDIHQDLISTFTVSDSKFPQLPGYVRKNEKEGGGSV